MLGLGGPREEPGTAARSGWCHLVCFLLGISRGISAPGQEKGAGGIRLGWNLSQSSLGMNGDAADPEWLKLLLGSLL